MLQLAHIHSPLVKRTENLFDVLANGGFAVFSSTLIK